MKLFRYRISARLTIIILISVGLTIFCLNIFSVLRPEPKFDIVPQEFRLFWRKEIEDIGPVSAYAKLKEIYANAPRRTSHLAAHLFGEVIEQDLGDSGISTCDSTFVFGCYHGFFASIMRKSPALETDRLIALCATFPVNSRINCEHGIGHGLAEFFGSNIPKALSVCREIAATKELRDQHFGCLSAVFMEHMLPFIENDSNDRARPVDADMYSPCDTPVANGFERSCYFNLPGQWYFRQHIDPAKNNDLCRAAPNQKAVSSCLLGHARGVCLNLTSPEKVEDCFGIFFERNDDYLRDPENGNIICGSLPSKWQANCGVNHTP